MGDRLERFGMKVDGAIDDALKEGLEPDDIELALQRRAQDMREYLAREDD